MRAVIIRDTIFGFRDAFMLQIKQTPEKYMIYETDLTMEEAARITRGWPVDFRIKGLTAYSPDGFRDWWRSLKPGEKGYVGRGAP